MKYTLTVDRLRELLDYAPETGHFKWKLSEAGHRNAKRPVGSTDTKGRRQIRVDGVLYSLPRLAFLWMTGDWPVDQVDHINRDFTDNRWSNLRNATGSLNSVNRRSVRTKNRDLPRGVHKLPSGRFSSVIQENKRLKHLGVFDTVAEARATYLNKAREIYGGFLPD